MSRKPTMPGVDEKALASLARQFPSGGTGSPDAGAAADGGADATGAKPGAADNATDTAAGTTSEGAKEKAKTEKAKATTPRRRSGRLLAALALIVALLALLAAGSAVAPPELLTWVKETTRAPRIVGLLSGRRDAVDALLASDSTAIKALQQRTQETSSRVEAIEAVGGSSTAAARRIDVLEATVTSLIERTVANEELFKALLARFERVEQMETTLEASVKTAAERAGAAEEAVKSTGERIASLEGSLKESLGDLGGRIDTFTKVDQRFLRFYIVAARLQNVTRGSNPFAKEAAAVRSLAEGHVVVDAALNILASHAGKGVASVGKLKATFETVLLPRMAALSPANRRSFPERVMSWARSVVSTAPSSYAPRDNRNATVLGLAERSLAEGQLAPAVDQLLLLEDRAALVAAEWLREAGARLAVDTAAETILAKAFDQLVAPR